MDNKRFGRDQQGRGKHKASCGHRGGFSGGVETTAESSGDGDERWRPQEKRI